MNGTAAKTVRRDLRRAVGESALQEFTDQQQAVRHLVSLSNRHSSQLQHHEQRTRDLAVANTVFAAFTTMTFLERFRWLFLGRG